jgi:hypothetical protein
MTAREPAERTTDGTGCGRALDIEGVGFDKAWARNREEAESA